MNATARIAVAIFLLAIAAFCGFGFLATFEPLDRGTQLFWRIVYGLVGLACLAQILWLARAKKA
jgi:hypothetical protein